MSFSPNKSYNLQVTGTNVGTWGIPNNSNFSTIDLNFGGRLNLSVAGSSNITVTSSQAQNVFHNLSGALTGNIDYILPSNGGFYFIYNGTTGGYVLTVAIGSSSNPQFAIPQGQTGFIFCNPDNTVSYGIINMVFSGIGATVGTANAQSITVTPGPFNLAVGNIIYTQAGYTNTGALTLTAFGPNSTGAQTVLKNGTGALTACVGGEVQAGGYYGFIWNGSNYVLLNPTIVGALLAANNLSDVSNAVTALSNLFPPGFCIPYAGSTAPGGWLFANAQAVSRTTYANLFSVIGTTYGSGDGSTTFNVPDIRGNIPAGLDNMGGVSSAGRLSGVIASTTLGTLGGNQYLHAHSHGVTDPTHGHSFTAGFNEGPGGGQAAGENGENTQNTGSGTSASATGISIQTAGSGSSQNVQPTIMLNYLIKT